MRVDNDFIDTYKKAYRVFAKLELMNGILADCYTTRITRDGTLGKFASLVNDFTMASGIKIETDRQRASFMVACIMAECA